MGCDNKMLQDALIDHRRTSSNHPQANGLAERCVRTLKHGLKKQVRLLNPFRGGQCEGLLGRPEGFKPAIISKSFLNQIASTIARFEALN